MGDRYGRRRPMLLGLALYATSSMVAMVAPDMNSLIVARFFQAVGGAASIVLVRSIVRDTWPTTEGARVLSQLVLIMGAAPILAPTLGGFVLGVSGWRSIFGILTIAALLLFVVVFRGISDGKPLASGVGLGANVGLVLRDPVFRRFSAVVGFAQAGMFAYISAAPFVFIEAFGLAPSTFAIVFGMNAAAYIVVSQLNRWLLTRFALIDVMTAGATLLALDALVLVVGVTLGGGLWLVEGAIFCFLGLLGITVANAMALSIDRQASRAGLASGMMGTLQYTLAALGSASVAAFADGSALPMTGVMLGCAVATAVATLLGRRAIAEPEPQSALA